MPRLAGTASARCFGNAARVLLLPLYVLLLLAGLWSPLRATEILTGGDMGHLDDWDQRKLPMSFVCEIADENSPFTEVYADNGRCLLVSEAPGHAHRTFLVRQLDAVGGRLVFRCDFKLKESTIGGAWCLRPNSWYNARLQSARMDLLPRDEA
jgi:hypothetical protein